METSSVSSPRVRAILMAVMIGLAVLAGGYILSTPGLKPVVVSIYGPPTIWAEQRVRDVGEVKTDSSVGASFILYNKGGKYLRILDVQTSCGCTVASVSKKVLAPGDYAEIQATMDTSLKQGKVIKKISVRSNDPARPELDLYIQGQVLASKMAGHAFIKAKDPLALFKGTCATCHVQKGRGKTGKALFQADCAMCHGATAQGHKPAGPSLLNGAWESEAYRQQMRAVIANGSPNSPQMPPFSQAKGGPLNEDEIDSLVNFLKFAAVQKQMGLLKEETDEVEDQAAFDEALKQPH